MNKRNLILFGFMGTGKSTVGRIAAGRLQLPFVDMDAEIEARTARTIADIFAKDGEAAFRSMERELVVELAGRGGQVISTGGGVVLDRRNIEDFSRTGFLVCLTAHEDELIRRLAGARNRPLLDDVDRDARLRALFRARRQFYESIPNTIDTTRLSPRDTAAAVVRLFMSAQA